MYTVSSAGQEEMGTSALFFTPRVLVCLVPVPLLWSSRQNLIFSYIIRLLIRIDNSRLNMIITPVLLTAF
jgi:hypothetical protein